MEIIIATIDHVQEIDPAKEMPFDVSFEKYLAAVKANEIRMHIGHILLTDEPEKPIAIQLEKSKLELISEDSYCALMHIAECLSEDVPIRKENHQQPVTSKNCYELVNIINRACWNDVQAELTTEGQKIFDQNNPKPPSWWKRMLAMLQKKSK